MGQKIVVDKNDVDNRYPENLLEFLANRISRSDRYDANNGIEARQERQDAALAKLIAFLHDKGVISDAEVFSLVDHALSYGYEKRFSIWAQET